ncbi:hypothetical protein QAD02_022747 [Eretmocerus hayati]|uniref:Uncharacterized protein n=1 Tax=Eretmocerus hayati TaxID=131215 RepID=A0ACC2PVH9_9HYME|nr:hypothetical protein QAD02_022747 [Eretmocerus hayati]
MPIPSEVVSCFKYVDLNVKSYIQELEQIVKIPNVSSDLEASSHLEDLVKWLIARLKQLGFTVQIREPDFSHPKYKGKNKPPIVLAFLGNDSKKKTLVYYSHLDVLKVQRPQWKTDPFELTKIDGKLYGRGTAKMKGPLLCFIHAVESYLEMGIELPINIKILCESMFECRSAGLRGILDNLKSSFLADADCVLMTESHWLGSQHPCVVYGTRGVCYFNLTIEGAIRDLSSGDFGGVIREPMFDLLHIFSSLVDPFGIVRIPEFYDDIVDVTPDEEDFYKKIQIEIEEYRKIVGVEKLGHGGDLKKILMRVWRYPWVNLHYVNTSCQDGNLLNIPRKVLARFSIRSVPNQKHERVSKMVMDYVNELAKQSKTPNKVIINTEHPLDPWYENHLHWNYNAACTATKQVYKEDASFIREGNGFPTLLKLRDAMPNRNILILPIVNSEAKAHSEEENISLRNYIEGTKLLIAYFYELPRAAVQHVADKKASRRPKICRNKL